MTRPIGRGRCTPPHRFYHKLINDYGTHRRVRFLFRIYSVLHRLRGICIEYIDISFAFAEKG